MKGGCGGLGGWGKKRKRGWDVPLCGCMCCEKGGSVSMERVGLRVGLLGSQCGWLSRGLGFLCGCGGVDVDVERWRVCGDTGMDGHGMKRGFVLSLCVCVCVYEPGKRGKKSGRER